MRRSSSGTHLLWATLIALIFVVAIGPAPAHAATSDTTLADRYAPILELKAQRAPCDATGEQFVPSPVEIVLGNPEVRLLRGSEQLISLAPTAEQIAPLGPNYYLDLPGNPLHPGCTYEQASQQLMHGRQPTSYAHIATEPGVTGIVVQYWFFYYFNQFNDLHEGDWEMMQVVWDHVSTVAAALQTPPDRVALAQHGTGQTAAWTSTLLVRDGTHPVVYPASGSHATYFGSHLYLGSGQQGAGLGCDNTQGPSEHVRPVVVILPTIPPATGPFAWLGFQGHWGQQEVAFNTGPTGPVQHLQWSEPIRWTDSLQGESPIVPLSSSFGPSVTGAFCATVATGSSIFNTLSHSPWLLAAIVLVILGIIIAIIRATTWTPTPLWPLAQTRSSGQILVAGLMLSRIAWRPFLAIGAVFVPISVVSLGLEHALLSWSGLDGVLGVSKNTPGSAVISLLTGTFGFVIAYNVVVSLVVAGMSRHLTGGPIRLRESFGTTVRRIGPLVVTQLGVTIALTCLALTIVGIPLAIKKAVDWSFTPIEVIVEEHGPRAALRESTRLVHGGWWRKAVFTASLTIAMLTIGPLIGFVMIFVTPIPLGYINILGSIIYALAVPYSACCLALFYLTARHGRTQEASPAISG
jgi:hypothetical protein